jgi:hypothetical protein
VCAISCEQHMLRRSPHGSACLKPTIAVCQTAFRGGCGAILANPCASYHLTLLLTSNVRYEDSEVDDEEDEEEEEEEEEGEGEAEEEDEDEG